MTEGVRREGESIWWLICGPRARGGLAYPCSPVAIAPPITHKC